ncbi:MAG: hypothetical protein JSV65_07060 [Armatimonadota bacterium]|nr:MAG: hypothetical protein JSV65_07060 [Armatimonadota bacterium]
MPDPGHRDSTSLVDLTTAVVVTAGPTADAVERQAALMLRWEVQKRTGLEWPEVAALPADDVPAIIVGSRERMPAAPRGAAMPEPEMKHGKPAAEGYVLAVDAAARRAPTVYAIGNDRRGALFAIGRLLRSLDWADGEAQLPSDLEVSSAPAYPIRGMQLGYRQLNDTLDAWDVSRYAQYVRDLIVFGNNAVELIPPVSPGSPGLAIPDPLMPLHPWDMTLAVSAVLDAYDMDVWFWLPLESGAAEDSERRVASLRERDALFRACRRIDHLFVPGGDPGDTPPQILMPYLRELGDVLRRSHPNAQLWVSPQKFRREHLKDFYEYLQTEEPDWLAGVVWGPGCIGTLPYTREMIPERYPIRHYPDITHAKVCQFPFPYWDVVWAQAYERQPIQPRPAQFAHICNLLSPYTPGAVAYSDGTGDDVNKIVWDALLWDPEVDVREVLRDFGRYFVGPGYADDVADGLLMLEQNWAGPAATNPQVEKTLVHWQAMEKRASPKVLSNWRLQQGLIRAYADAYVQKRAQQETALLGDAYAELRKAPEIGPDAALTKAEEILRSADPHTAAPALRARTHELADMLFDSIGMQLSIEKHGASALDRGAQLDNNDGPLTDCPWLLLRIAEIRTLPDRDAQLAAIDEIVNWTDPGLGGFYDDLGNRANGTDPHLVREIPWEDDPGFLHGVQDAHYGPGFPHRDRQSWAHQAQVYRPPLRMRYTGLDPQGSYVLKATYAGRGRMSIQLYLGGEAVGEAVEFDGRDPVVRQSEVPRSAVAEGTLDVMWDSTVRDDVQIAEVWLLRKG